MYYSIHMSILSIDLFVKLYLSITQAIYLGPVEEFTSAQYIAYEIL